MIRIHHTGDAMAAARAVERRLAETYGDLPVQIITGTTDPRQPPIPDATGWDDLLLVVFGTEALSDRARDAIAMELDRSASDRRRPRLLPVSALADRPVPPPPMDTIKALPCIGPSDAELTRIARRTGALLGLWTRGPDKRVFVSYRAADGALIAEQVTGFLQAQGYTALRDEEWLEGGDRVQLEIERRLASASLVLLLDTPRANESDWIRQEIDGAIARFVPILPVVLRTAEDKAKGPRFRALRELERWASLTADPDPNGVCRPLDDAGLRTLLEEMENYLSDVLRAQMALLENARDSFRRAGFDATPLAGHGGLFETSRADEGFAAIRVLTYCSPLPPTFHRAVEELKRFPRPAGGHAPSPLRYNYRIFLHQDPIPAPELESIAKAVGMAEEAQLRMLDPLGLELFLRRFRHITGASA